MNLYAQKSTPHGRLVLRHAVPDDAPMLARWDGEPHVIACTTDDPDATSAFQGADWREEIEQSAADTFYVIAELDGRPIGAMQVIDPHTEHTHYWGEIEPDLRALDIWIGETDAMNRGLGTAMMELAVDACFAAPEVQAIVIDPLNSNADAHRFYQRLGFQPEGRRLFNDEDDCLVHRLTREGWEGRPKIDPSPDGRRWPEGPDEGRMIASAQAAASTASRLSPTDNSRPSPDLARPIAPEGSRARSPSPTGRGRVDGAAPS